MSLPTAAHGQTVPRACATGPPIQRLSGKHKERSGIGPAGAGHQDESAAFKPGLPELGGLGLVRNRVVSALAPGTATQQPFAAQPASLDDPVLFDGFVGIDRTGRLEPARGGKER